MRYCSILILKQAREKRRVCPTFCDSESAKRQEKANAGSNSLSIILLIILVTFFALALIGAS